MNEKDTQASGNDATQDPSGETQTQQGHASAGTPGSAGHGGLTVEQQLEAMRAENLRLQGELSARYTPPAPYDPAAARGLAPARTGVDESELRALAEELGVKPERIEGLVSLAIARAESQVLGRVDQALRAQRVADRVAREFFERYPRLSAHQATVDQVVRAYASDPVRLRGRGMFQEDVLAEIAQESHRALSIEFYDARKAAGSGAGATAPAGGAAVIVPAGDVRSAQVATGRSGGGGAATPKPEPEPDPVSEWIGGIKDQRERGIAGAHGRLAGVQTR